MKKIMISQPMAGKTEEEIIETRNRFLEFAEDNNYEVVNTLFTDEWYSKEAMKSRDVRNVPLQFLAKSIENMGLCDIVYFAKGWEEARGCKIEHEVVRVYEVDKCYE